MSDWFFVLALFGGPIGAVFLALIAAWLAHHASRRFEARLQKLREERYALIQRRDELRHELKLDRISYN